MKTSVRRIKGLQLLGSAQSRSVLIDQPASLGGEDIGFRPTELWLIALTSCSVTTMSRYAAQMNYGLSGVKVDAEDLLNEDKTIEAVTFQVTFEGTLSAEQKTDLLQYVRKNCKLLKTVSPAVQISYVEAGAEGAGAVTRQCDLEDGSCCI